MIAPQHSFKVGKEYRDDQKNIITFDYRSFFALVNDLYKDEGKINDLKECFRYFNDIIKENVFKFDFVFVNHDIHQVIINLCEERSINEIVFLTVLHLVISDDSFADVFVEGRMPQRLCKYITKSKIPKFKLVKCLGILSLLMQHKDYNCARTLLQLDLIHLNSVCVNEYRDDDILLAYLRLLLTITTHKAVLEDKQFVNIIHFFRDRIAIIFDKVMLNKESDNRCLIEILNVIKNLCFCDINFESVLEGKISSKSVSILDFLIGLILSGNSSYIQEVSAIIIANYLRKSDNFIKDNYFVDNIKTLLPILLCSEQRQRRSFEAGCDILITLVEYGLVTYEETRLGDILKISEQATFSQFSSCVSLVLYVVNKFKEQCKSEILDPSFIKMILTAIQSDVSNPKTIIEKCILTLMCVFEFVFRTNDTDTSNRYFETFAKLGGCNILDEICDSSIVNEDYISFITEIKEKYFS